MQIRSQRHTRTLALGLGISSVLLGVGHLAWYWLSFGEFNAVGLGPAVIGLTAILSARRGGSGG